ncbi:hypothetical protein SCUCBS95973_006542 [Sporothrix curviconia]|uniref:O-methyltransferase domain-containing protein n=1 Tax=Sporothrix curviconia TaxID=1260050 RepID=A0ABP0C8F8_9PEZI
MSLLETILASVAANGGRLAAVLGDDVARLNNTVDDTPFDSPDSPLGAPDEAWNLAQDIMTDCYQLISVLMPRRMQAMKFCFASSIEYGIGIAAHFKVADHIERRGGIATAADLAKDCGTDAAKLTNVLQSLSGRHMFLEVEPEVFANNRHSRTLLSGAGAPEMLESYSIVSGKAFDGLLPLMTDRDNMHSIDPKKGAFAIATGKPMAILDWMMLPENKAYLAQILTGMPWLSDTCGKGTVFGYNWAQWGPAATVCDMGSSDGGIMSLLKVKHPGFHIICQDLAPMLPVATQTFNTAHPGAIEKGQVEILLHDYFQEQETDADAYWMRGVLHDYTEEECITILQNVAPRLRKNPKARILINEIVKPSLLTPDPKAEGPASKRVPRTQSAFIEMSSIMQLHSTAFLAGRERSYYDFRDLFDKAGYRIEHFQQLHLFSCIMRIALKE